jgi:large subunit ribosomal protein L29
MKIKDLKGKTFDQLETQLKDLKKESMNLRFQRVSGELANTARIQIVRRAIARIQTLLNQANSAA